MNVALVVTAVRYGAVVASHTEVVKLHKDSSGMLNGARVRDNLTGREWDVRAKVSFLVHLHRFAWLNVLNKGFQRNRTIYRLPPHP